jgi:hypothetical protein
MPVEYSATGTEDDLPPSPLSRCFCRADTLGSGFRTLQFRQLSPRPGLLKLQLRQLRLQVSFLSLVQIRAFGLGQHRPISTAPCALDPLIQ